MDIFDALILGIVQGITEFLPISSSGHLVLVQEFIKIDEVNTLAFDGVLHLATTLAVIIYFWSDILVLIQTAIRKLGRLPINTKDQTLLYALLIGTVPAVIIGLLFESIMNEHFQSIKIVGTMLFLAAIFFMYAEWRYYKNPPQGALTIRKGFLVGCFQALALLPGFSRSGSTLAGGMLLGMTRLESAKFSFLLAIPITLAVGIKMLLKLIVDGGSVAWLPVTIGACTSFVTALIVLHFFIEFIRRYTLWPFIWYSIILSMVVGYVAVYV